MLTVSLGLTAAASSQVPESVSLWRQWMSVLQREQSQTSGPRLYIQTEREIQQTGPLTAAFQSGSYKFVLADGSTPDTDGDVDGYTDRFEDGNPFANRDDPLAIPLVGNPPLPAPRDTWSLQFFAPTLLANGDFLGLAEPIVTSNTQAILVKPYSGSNVRVSAAPSSRLVRPAPLRDFSTSFNYFIRAPGQPVGVFQEFPISLYYFNKDYPNPTDGKTLEETIVPGVYSVEFPTIRNAPTGKAALQVGHRLVPNGALNVGLKKPSFIVRSLKSTERFNTPPVEQKWVNGRLKFDPYLPMNVSWDDLFKNGLASSGEFIEFSLEDEFGLPISFTFRVTAFTSSLNLNLSSDMYSIYGNIRSLMEQGSLPFSINGNIVLRYLRYANQQPQADLSSVTVRVPVELVVSYASWRNELFPFDSNTDAIAGPGADPDGDGLTNQQEFVAGSDPLVPTIAVADPHGDDGHAWCNPPERPLVLGRCHHLRARHHLLGISHQSVPHVGRPGCHQGALLTGRAGSLYRRPDRFVPNHPVFLPGIRHQQHRHLLHHPGHHLHHAHTAAPHAAHSDLAGQQQPLGHYGGSRWHCHQRRRFTDHRKRRGFLPHQHQ